MNYHVCYYMCQLPAHQIGRLTNRSLHSSQTLSCVACFLQKQAHLFVLLQCDSCNSCGTSLDEMKHPNAATKTNFM